MRASSSAWSACLESRGKAAALTPATRDDASWPPYRRRARPPVPARPSAQAQRRFALLPRHRFDGCQAWSLARFPSHQTDWGVKRALTVAEAGKAGLALPLRPAVVGLTAETYSRRRRYASVGGCGFSTRLEIGCDAGPLGGHRPGSATSIGAAIRYRRRPSGRSTGRRHTPTDTREGDRAPSSPRAHAARRVMLGHRRRPSHTRKRHQPRTVHSLTVFSSDLDDSGHGHATVETRQFGARSASRSGFLSK